MSFLLWLLGIIGLAPAAQAQPEQQISAPEIYSCVDTGRTTRASTQSTWATVKDTPYDVMSDDSLWKYVSPDIWLDNVEYVPADLVRIDNLEYIDVRNNEWKLRRDAASAIADLAQAFHKEFGKSLVIVSSYRGYTYQKDLLAWYSAKMGTWRAQGLSAKPWHSEHQLWLAVDVFNTSTDGEDGYKNYFSWMRANAHAFGWTQSYQKWQSTDGYVREPWHWRYVGIPLATYLWKHKITFSEYVNTIGN